MSRKELTVSTFIPETLGGDDVLLEDAPFVGTVEFNDGVIVFTPAFLYLLFGDLFMPSVFEPYTIFISLFIAMIGASTLIIKPKYMTLSEWIQQWRDFRQREKELDKKLVDENGEPFKSIDVVPDNDTRKLTKIDKVYPEHDILELEDGTMISMIEFTGSNLDMAPSGLVISTINQYSRAISSELRNDIQFFMPLRTISTDSTVERYQEQKELLDIETEGDEFLDAYLDNRISWVKSMGHSTKVRESYIIIPVKKREIRNTSLSIDKTGLEKLPAGEVLQDIKMGVTGESDIDSAQELKRKQIRELSNRRETVGSIIEKGPGNKYDIVSSKKMTALLKEFWEGEKIMSDEMNSLQMDLDFMVSTETEDENNQGDKI